MDSQVATLFFACICVAIAMGAPTTPSPADETLRQLINPTPEVIRRLNEVSNAIKASTSSLANLSPEATSSAANLNLQSGLNDIITQVIQGVLQRLRPESRTEPTPTGNDIFTNPGPVGTNGGVLNQIPSTNTNRQSRGGFFNPFGFMFSGASNPMSFLNTRMMMDAMEGFGEFF